MHYHWNWDILLQQPYFGWLVEGLLVTVALSLVAWTIALPLGTLIGMMRGAASPVARGVGGTYVQVFRNIPIVVQLFLWFFVLPEILPRAAGYFLKREMPQPEFVTAAVCVGFYTASRIAVIVQAGITSVGPGKANAARASGMTLAQTYRHVMLPLAFRMVLPPLVSEFLTVFKNSSIALTIGVFELTMQAHQIESYTFQGFEAFAAATVLYGAISAGCLATAQVLERRVQMGGIIGTAGDQR
jgi:glutamate/aspartate transport system permease protein